jgi:putative membrane protein
MTTTLRATAAVSAFLAFAAAACTPGSQPGTDAQRSQAASEAPAAASAAAQAPAIDDADIAAIVVAANTIDIRYGEIARERATNEQVKQFAETMIKDHTAVNQSATELVTRLGVTPTENDVSRSLEAQAAEMRNTLRSKSGAEFDRAYIDNEVAYHRAVLQAIDETLIPSASNAELKQTLVNVRPAIEAHLKHAEEIQRTLARGA